MCGRYALSLAGADLTDIFEIDEVAGPLPPPSYNIAPTDPVIAVLERHRSDGRTRVLDELRWGLVPSWAKDPSGAARLINARIETAPDKPSFRKAYAQRRCLLPATGYYEWLPATGPSGKPIKQPYFIRPADGGLLVMAGLYEFWKAPDAGWLVTATVLTTSATDELGRIHDRMPMAVPAENWAAWLDPEFGGEPRALLDVPVAAMAYHKVPTLVNRVANNGPELIEPLATE